MRKCGKYYLQVTSPICQLTSLVADYQTEPLTIRSKFDNYIIPSGV